ncbi:hypothetical protein BJ878DRAFT_477428 [Calycina marina]|uniref:Uncharacterized protein n=1 Tax=Calycina marina TaxID=1763456 RepID=A0A9P7Z9G2_9HELO|nr:hypothetical protein BJ878DRAFT_477428 [Calycina marina]
MRFSALASFALPLLAAAQSSTTTYTSTATQTKTITVSQIVASVTSTYSVPQNSSSVGTSSVGTTSYYTSLPISVTGASPTVTESTGATTTSLPVDVSSSASSVNSMFAGSAAVVLMLAATLL